MYCNIHLKYLFTLYKGYANYIYKNRLFIDGGTMDNYVKTLTAISILIFLVMIPIAYLNGVYGWIPDIAVFVFVTLFYYWMYDTFRMTMPIFTFLIIAHILHAGGIFGWYYVSPVPIRWEIVTHLAGGFAFSLLIFRWMEQWLEKKFTKKTWLVIIGIFLAATGIGAVVELSEFVGYLFAGEGEGAFQFGPGDGVAGKEGTELIDALGGGWINEGWDFVFNTGGILVGMVIMAIIRSARKESHSALDYEPIVTHSRKV